MDPQKLKIVSLAMLGSTILYIVVAFVLASSNGWSFTWTTNNSMLLFIFGGIACVLAGAVLVLGKLPLIPRLAIAEAIAILGLVAAFLSQSPLWVLPFAGLSLLLQVFLSPFFTKADTSEAHIR
jgi:hypothetical protein